MKKIFLSVSIIFVLTSTAIAQADCNCANKPEPQKYKAKVDKGENVQVNAQCATLALYLCMCDCPTTKVDRKQLESNIRSLISDIRNWEKIDGVTYYPGMPASKECPKAGTAIGQDGGAGTTEKQRTAADNNNDAVGFANSLGQLTNDPKAQEELAKINKRHDDFAAAKNIASTAGASQKQIEAIDNMETLSHLGNFLLGGGATDADIKKREEERRKNLSSATIVSEKMEQLSEEIFKLHKATINDYDNKTAPHRLVYLKFITNKFKEEDSEYFTETELKNLVDEVENIHSQKGVDHVKSEIDRIMTKPRFDYRKYDYLRNHRTNDSSDGLRAFALSPTFDVSKDKTYKIQVLANSARLKTFNVIGAGFVFESKNVNKGWDGTWQKQPKPPGEYTYVFDGYDSYGQYFYKVGTFNLVR